MADPRGEHRLKRAKEPAWIASSDAVALVSGRTEKPGGVDPARWFEGDAHVLYALARVPLSSFAPNEAGDFYDGTVDPNRARAYARRATQAPPVIAVPSRDGSCLRILDGGHRLSAAMMRSDRDILAIVRVKEARLAELGPMAKIQGWAPSRSPALEANPAARYGSGMQIFIATHESRNFAFDAFGLSEREAREAFKLGLDEHVKQYAAAPGVGSWAKEVMEDLEVREVQTGAAYRDRQALSPAPSPAQAPARPRWSGLTP
jgi:hypothetical protein